MLNVSISFTLLISDSLLSFLMKFAFVADATTLSFDGSQHMKIDLVKDRSTQSEDIVLRFKTNRPNGIILTTSTEKSSDKLQLAIDTGRITLSINVGDGRKVMNSTV